MDHVISIVVSFSEVRLGRHSNSKMKSNTQATINELIAGSVRGAMQVLVGQPLATVKTWAQVAPSSVLNFSA